MQYPSSMIAMNLSHETYVNDPGYLNTPGVDFETIEYDNYEYVKMGSGDVLTKVLNTKEPVRRCIFAQPSKDESGNIIDATRGVVPRILQSLLSARKATKKRMANESDNFRKGLLDALQAAYKVTANSVYGQMGASTSPVSLKELAASCTATGRRSLLFARDYMVKEYGATAVYGDSVAAYTPILVRKSSGTIEVIPIESLAEACKVRWYIRADQKQVAFVDGIEVWSDDGWTGIKQIVRHALPAEKKLVRVMTHTGLVDVTDDHSLLTHLGRKISPRDVRVGDHLLHHPFPDADGIGNMNYSRFNTRMQECCNAHRKGHSNTLRFDPKQHNECAQFVFMARYLSIPTLIDVEEDGTLVLTMEVSITAEELITPCAVRKIYELDCMTDFVYDLTTSNSHFAAGIGDLIVHNTDSVFMHFKCKDADGKPLRGLEAVRESIRICTKASSEVSRLLPAPNNLDFEKVIYPFLLLSKKRYVGGYFESETQMQSKIKHMGVVLKRRDNAPIVKHFYAGVVDILLRHIDTPEFQAYLRENPAADVRSIMIKRAQKFVQTETKKLLAAKFPTDRFILSKSLRGEYKNPDSIAHRTLADRANDRGTDNFQSNDRIAYVHVVTKEKKGSKLLQGEKIETPQYAEEQGLKIDYKHYITNAIEKPVSQIFALALEALDGYNPSKHASIWQNIDDHKKREEKRMKVAAEILFKSMITAYETKLSGCRLITDFWGR